MATSNTKVNYDDDRFAQVETDKKTAINEVNNVYNEMVNSTDKFYQDQIKASQDYAKTQADLQNQNTQFAIDTINQQKEQTEKDYKKEQTGAYVDWQKQSNQYGVNAEQQATQGLNNTGYSESSQVSMYNQYQSRVATARETFNKAVMNFDNSIRQAELANNSKQAEIAYQALQTQLELSLQGFQYKNQLLLDQVNKKQELDNTYYSRYQDVLNQINTENSMAEQVRQYNENLKLQKEQMAEEKRQYEQSYALQTKEYEESIRQFDTQIAYYKEKDAKEYALKIKQLEEEKRQREIAQQQWEKEYKLKQQQMQQEQARWEKEYALSKAKTYSSTATQQASINKTASQDTLSKSGNSFLKMAQNALNSAMSQRSGSVRNTQLRYITNNLNAFYKQGRLTESDVRLISEKLGI